MINIDINYTKKDNKVVYLNDNNTLVYNDKSIKVEEKIDLYDVIDNIVENS